MRIIALVMLVLMAIGGPAGAKHEPGHWTEIRSATPSDPSAAVRERPDDVGVRNHREARHSGRLLQIAPDGRIVIAEMLAWTGPGTGVVERSFELTSETSMQVVTRDPNPDPSVQSATWGFRERQISAAELNPGDFVTVTVARTGGGARVVSREAVPGEGIGTHGSPGSVTGSR